MTEAESGIDIERIMGSIQRIAAGDFEARLERSFDGSEADVLAFLLNALSEEVGALVEQLHQEREALEGARDRMIQAEKLAGLGMLAGGVAHEMNQPLSVIRSLTQLVLLNPQARVSDHREDLRLVESAANRMAKIVDSVRSFGRAQPTQLRAIDPLVPLGAAMRLLGESLRQAGIEVERRVDPDLPRIVGDGDRLQQVFVNLVANARDALIENEVEGRRIRLGVRRDGAMLAYEVSDNGPGVSAAIVDNIFDPFFTTKEPGKGTGLGLSVSLGIVQDHRGELTVRSAEDGAHFSVRIPIADGAP